LNGGLAGCYKHVKLSEWDSFTFGLLVCGLYGKQETNLELWRNQIVSVELAKGESKRIYFWYFEVEWSTITLFGVEADRLSSQWCRCLWSKFVFLSLRKRLRIWASL
jgi:hypothetical protein